MRIFLDILAGVAGLIIGIIVNKHRIYQRRPKDKK